MSHIEKILQVDLAERSYPIYIGSKFLSDADYYRPHILGRQVLIVSNETVAPLYLHNVLSAVSEYRVESVILPDGEEFKNLEVWQTIIDALLTHRFDRSCTLLALGGGVVGDMTGYAAASYQRGVNFIQVPTTLLSQVDSSVGGKTGVNHPLGKNMIGAFHQPKCVLADINSLSTLDDRQLSAGLAEVIKYALINDLEFMVWLEANIDGLMARDEALLAYAVERSCHDKACVVSADEKESGQRALLNLGHTFGHAIETGMGYGKWLHGEAIAAGMCMAAEFSQQLGWMALEDVERVKHLIIRAGLPIQPPALLSGDQLFDLMAVDKKVLNGRLRLILMKGIAESIVTDDFEVEVLKKYLKT